MLILESAVTTKYVETFPQYLSRRVYSLLTYILLPLVGLLLIHKSIKKSKAYATRWQERFAFIPKAKAANGYLFHCVSVGEVNSAACVIKSILKSHPHIPVTLTCTTPTGSARVLELFKDKVLHFYLPFDTPLFMRILLNRIQPQKVIIAEVELWPNLVHACWKKDIPCIIINARMTNKSLNSYQRYPSLFEPMCRKLTKVYPQSALDYQNYLSMSVLPSQLMAPKNIKFDQTEAPILGKRMQAYQCLIHSQKRQVIIAASTHQSEEKFCLKVYAKLKEEHANLLLIIVPRHPERFGKVEKKLKKKKYSYVTWSKGKALEKQNDVLLIDTMGKLSQAYALANMAFVGGSLVKKGGHNPLEAAQCNLPIIMGPHIYNNAEISESLQNEGALHIVHDKDAAITLFNDWLNKPCLAKEHGKAGANLLLKNKGALDKTLGLVLGA